MEGWRKYKLRALNLIPVFIHGSFPINAFDDDDNISNMSAFITQAIPASHQLNQQYLWDPQSIPLSLLHCQTKGNYNFWPPPRPNCCTKYLK